MSLSLTVASHNSISLRKKEVLGFTLIFISARIDDFTDWKIEKITTQSEDKKIEMCFLFKVYYLQTKILKVKTHPI